MHKVTLFRPSVNGKKRFWYIKYIDDAGREIRRTTRLESKTEAKKFASSIYKANVEKTANITLLEHDLSPEDAWCTYANSVTKKKRTLDNECSFWCQFWKWSGLSTMKSVTVGDVARWQRSLLDGGNKPVSVNDKVRQIATVFNTLIRLQEYDGENPFAKVKRIPQPKSAPKFLPWEDILSLLEHARGVGRDIHLVFILGALAGLRKDEILRARWEHVDWAAGCLTVDGTKTEASSGRIPLHDALRAALGEYRADYGYIVKPGKRIEKNMYRWEFRAQWKRVVALAGDEVHISPHMLRHSVATHLLDIGYTLAEIAVFLRHNDIRATQIYANLKGVSLKMERF